MPAAISQGRSREEVRANVIEALRDLTHRPTPTLRRGEAAERLGVHPNTLAGWVQRGWLASIEMPGGEVRFGERDVEELRERVYAQ